MGAEELRVDAAGFGGGGLRMGCFLLGGGILLDRRITRKSQLPQSRRQRSSPLSCDERAPRPRRYSMESASRASYTGPGLSEVPCASVAARFCLADTGNRTMEMKAQSRVGMPRRARPGATQ